MPQPVNIIGGGLAGSEAAWQIANRGLRVRLFEMRPQKTTGAHVSDRLAELVCSNSLGSKLPDRATGLLQAELRVLRSLLIEVASETAVAAGGALAVDREAFAERVTAAIYQHPLIEVVREEVTRLPEEPTIIATGPLTSPGLASSIVELTGENDLYFYDAVSPIVAADSIDMTIAFRASRYSRGQADEGDYINCPMNQDEYQRFVEAVRQAETVELRGFEREDPRFFEGCLPIEQLAARGDDTLRFGPMRPVGLRNPRTGKQPYAAVQLRQDNLAASLYNMVGFQTNMRWGDQERALRMIPGLADVEFIRLGQMHRNTFINTPMLLEPTMRSKKHRNLFFAGQITGVEGYVGNVATGLVAAVNLARQLTGNSDWIPPKTTMIGALCHYVTHAEPGHFQPMKANFGLMPELPVSLRGKQQRAAAHVERARQDLLLSASGLEDPYLHATSSFL